MRSTRIVPRFVTGLLCIALIVILGAAGTSSALALDTTTRGSAPLWFKFHVGSVDPDTNTSHVSVTLRNQAACGGGFQVFASGPWSYWAAPDEDDLMGRATDIGFDQYMWTGELVPGAYYVRVGYGAQPNCVLGVSGQAVDHVGVVDLGWHLAETRNPVAAQPAVTAAEPPAVTTEAAATMDNDHHDMAMVPNEWMPVTNNDPMTFKFKVGRTPDEYHHHVLVTLQGAPFRGGSFEIYTAAGVPFGQPEQDDWFGKAVMVDGEHPSWSGNLVPGTYYVRVYPEGMKNCLLAISGEAITF